MHSVRTQCKCLAPQIDRPVSIYPAVDFCRRDGAGLIRRCPRIIDRQPDGHASSPKVGSVEAVELRNEVGGVDGLADAHVKVRVENVRAYEGSA